MGVFADHPLTTNAFLRVIYRLCILLLGTYFYDTFLSALFALVVELRDINVDCNRLARGCALAFCCSTYMGVFLGTRAGLALVFFPSPNGIFSKLPDSSPREWLEIKCTFIPIIAK